MNRLGGRGRQLSTDIGERERKLLMKGELQK